MIPQESNKVQENLIQGIFDIPTNHTVSLKLEKTSVVLIAYDETLIATVYSKLSYFINHYSNTGVLLKTIAIKNVVALTMASQFEVCIIQANIEGELYLTIWDLRSYKQIDIQIGHELINQKNSLHHLFNFKTTNILCYCYSNKKFMKLLYFRLPLTPESEPFHIYNHSEGNLSLIPIQGNMHSMIIFIGNSAQSYRYYNQDQTQHSILKLYSLRKGLVSRLKKIALPEVYSRDIEYWMEEGAKSRLDLKDAKNRALRRGINYQDKIRLSAVDAWQVRPYLFYIKCKSQSQSKIFYTLFLDVQKNQSYMSPVFKYTSTHPHCMQFTSRFRELTFLTSKRISDKYQKMFEYNVPIYYMDWQTDQIMSMYSGEPKQNDQRYDGFPYKYGTGKFWFTSDNGGRAIEYWYDFLTCLTHVRIKNPCPTWYGLKVISVFFMMQLMPYCDDDLLFYVEQFVYDYFEETKKKNKEIMKLLNQNMEVIDD